MTRIPIRVRAGFALCAWLLFACAALAHAAPSVRAWLDRDAMQLGETVTLNLETSEANAAPPDFSALKRDFNLVGTQSSQQLSIVNGASTTKTLWAVGLEPKHDGHITIAPITVGGATSAPIELNVQAPSPGTPPQAGGDVFIEVAAEPLAPYVQQQVSYTVKLYYAFDLTDGNLGEPKADGLGAQRLGQDRSYIATLGARRYHVIERHYALTPERSGTIEIPALAFRGTALDVTDPTGFFSRGRTVSARSQALQLEVKPKPAAWTDAPWLPAASLQLQDNSELPNEVHVGEPITRTVRLQAQGLGYEQLPELTLSAPAGAEMYPDKADTRTRDDGTWLYGERVRKFAFVPNRPGRMTIPGLTLRWWNTQADRAEVAELPPRTISVLAAAGAPATPAAGTPSAAPGAVAGSGAPAIVAAASTPTSPRALPRERLWQVLAGAGFALWLLTLVLWWRSRHRMPAAAVTTAAVAPDTAAQRAAFLRACSLGEFAGAERALIAWARGERADVRNLGELAARLAADAQREALADLQRARYAGASTQGLASRLAQAFKPGLAWRDASAPRRAEAALPALYPERDK